MLYSNRMKDFLFDLSKTSRFDFQLWTAEKGLVFSSGDEPAKKGFGRELREFAKKIIHGDGFQQARFQKVDAAFGLPVVDGSDVVGSLTICVPEFYDPSPLQKKDSDLEPAIKEIKTFLTHLAQIVDSQLSSQIETEKMTEELSRSFEDLYLYSKIY